MIQRRQKAAFLVICALSAHLGTAAPSSNDASSPAVTAGRAGDPILLDGLLDEPAWLAAGVIEALTQQSPRPGEPTPYATTARILVDRDTIYIGVSCFDPDPAAISVHTLQRDGEFEGDDFVAVVLDTFGDGRTGYLFRVNAAGAMQDGLISGPEEWSGDWDGIWDARTSRSSAGWTAEIAIPARSLLFDRDRREWGLNLERYLPRERTTLRWAGATLDATLYDLRRAGRLGGLGGLDQGKGISFTPYALARRGRDFVRRDTAASGDVGAEVGWNVTPRLSTILTINTDFAETEVDARQINLTRFDLFFPEKRAFFLEGSNQWEFAAGLGEDFIPFYSRRVGLIQGRVVPIDAGAKILGGAGRWGIAALGVRMGESPLSEAATLAAGRFTYDAGDHLRLGTTLTRGDPQGALDNSLAGLDAVWRTSSFLGDKNFAVSGWGARSWSDRAGPGNQGGWGFQVDYPNDLWNVMASFNEFGDGLDPGLGFLPRAGIRKYTGGAAFQPRPEGGVADWVRQFFFMALYGRYDSLDGETESQSFDLWLFNLVTQSGEWIESNITPRYEHLREPFEVARGVFIPPGSYRFGRYRAEARSSEHRPWHVGGEAAFGAFYNGRLTQTEIWVGVTMGAGRLRFELASENNYGEFPSESFTWTPPGGSPQRFRSGDFVQRLHQLSVGWALSPRLNASVFLQYDTESRNLGTNTRVRWTLRPEADLFLVWNRDWESAPGSGARDLAPLTDQAVIKLRWTFRG